MNVGSIITSASATLRHVALEHLVSADLLDLHPPVTSPLAAVAPQLRTFTIHFDPRFVLQSQVTCFDGVVGALRDIRTLRLGLNGVRFSSVFSSLQPLEHLSFVGIVGAGDIGQATPCSDIISPVIIDFLVQSSSIRHVTLPKQLKGFWSKEEIARVSMVAQEQGVKAELA